VIEYEELRFGERGERRLSEGTQQGHRLGSSLSYKEARSLLGVRGIDDKEGGLRNEREVRVGNG
jgi:hypothetical protein